MVPSPKHHYKKLESFSRHTEGLDKYLCHILGPKFTEYRQVWSRIGIGKTVADFPLFPVVETKFACNLKCRICHKSDNETRRSLQYAEILSMGLFKRIVDEMADYRCPSLGLNNNNEPLLDPFILERIAYASQKGIMDTIMHTNAILLSDDCSRSLVENRLTRLLISLDAANASTFTKIRGNYFEKILDNIESFLKIRDKAGTGLPVLRLSFCVNRLNEHEQEEFLDAWKDVADEIVFQRYTPPVKKPQYTDLYPESRTEMHFSCTQPFERAVIRGNGDVYPCCFQSMAFPAGNIKTQTLYDIWHSPKFDEYRRITREEDWNANPSCRACSKIR